MAGAENVLPYRAHPHHPNPHHPLPALPPTNRPARVPRSQSIPFLRQPGARLHDTPLTPVSISPPKPGLQDPEAGSIRQVSGGSESRRSSRSTPLNDASNLRLSAGSDTSLPLRPRASDLREKASNDSLSRFGRYPTTQRYSPRIEENVDEENDIAPALRPGRVPDARRTTALHYFAFDDEVEKSQSSNHSNHSRIKSQSTASSSSGDLHQSLAVPRGGLARPASYSTLGAELRRSTISPLSTNSSDSGSPYIFGRDASSSRRSPSSRPASYVDLLNNVPYNQQIAPTPPLNNLLLQNSVGSAASLLETKKTLEMYRANAKKTTDVTVLYEFAIFMVNTAQDVTPEDGLDSAELINEAKSILQRLSDRAYPFAQYYLADGYSSGLFNKDKPDHDRAFWLFVAASKHGHAESSFRAALCYEFGWGCGKSYPKAVQYFRNAASRNHPGAATRLGQACLRSDMGLRDKYREGVKWLKRAQENPDRQHNAGPYELGVLHLQGYGADIFKDEAYAVKLITQSAELGHVEANFFLGQAYETGLYGCPRDAALSVHFYNGAASRNHVDAMMALCAWYIVGAPPVLEKNESEAYAWAKQAADNGYAKAEYAVGYFTEMGIGCRRDPLEANVWYVRAADQGSETARQRLALINAAAAGASGTPMSKAEPKTKELALGKEGKKKLLGIF